MMLISIVIPAYIPSKQRLSYLEESLRSATGQTHAEIEIILIDGGSTEDVEKLAESFNDPRIKYFKEPFANVFTININRGISRATGDAVMFLSADDNILPDCVAALSRLLENNPESVLAYCDTFFIDGTGKRTSVQNNMPSADENSRRSRNMLDILLRRNVIFAASALMRKSVLDRMEQFSVDPAYAYAADYDMWVRFAQAGPFEHEESPLVEYRIHDEQLSTGGSCLIPTLTLVKKWQNEFLSTEHQKILGEHEAELLMDFNRNCLRTGLESEAVKYWWLYSVKIGKPWLFPAIVPQLLKWRRIRYLIKEKSIRF
jgi:glycosyltransferase involved in cell wall biosynthesis